MTSASDVIIPSFSSNEISPLPDYYQSLAKHLAAAGFIILKNPPEKLEKEKP